MNRLLFSMFFFCLLGTILTAGVHAGGRAALVEPVRSGGISDADEPATLAGSQTSRLWLPFMLSAAASYGNLQELISPSFDYGDWYEIETGYPTSVTVITSTIYFGAYALEPAGSTLYLGFGSGRPADIDGALLASTDGVAVTAIYSPTEQGFIDMTVQGDSIIIPGADPCCGDDWTFGNSYVYTPSVPTVDKHRNLPNILHSWGVWFDGSSILYEATSGCHESRSQPNETTCEDYYLGKLFSTTDKGSTWVEVARGDVASGGIGQYRTYDIIGFADKLYITWNDVYGEPCGIAESSDAGATWTRLPLFSGQTTCRTRLFVYDNQLLVLSSDRTALLALDSGGTVTTHSFPGFSVRDWAYNYLAEDGSGRLYTVTEDGRIMRSSDLTTWETMAATDRSLITLAYWPDKDWLIATDRGLAHARLFKLDLSTASAITQPAAPATIAAIDSGQLKLDWADGPAGYRVYRSTSPYFGSDISLLAGTPPLSEFSDNSLGDANTNYYYTVRNADADGNLSPDSNLVGEFDFALVSGS